MFPHHDTYVKSVLMEDDHKLWLKIQHDDAGAVKLLFDRYYYQLLFYGKRLCPNSSVLDEAISDCFIKLWTKRNDLIISHSVKSYLFLMLRNGLIDYHRKKKNIVLMETASIPDLPDEETYSELDKFAQLYKALEKLPEQRRRIFELAVFEKHSYSQIAKKLQISINTVKTQMGRAYRFLKEELDPKSLHLLFLIKSS